MCKDKETKKQTLILIDVTGGGIMTAEAKLERISNWIGEQKLDDSKNTTIIGQEEALQLLGGLGQIFHWLIEDQEA